MTTRKKKKRTAAQKAATKRQRDLRLVAEAKAIRARRAKAKKTREANLLKRVKEITTKNRKPRKSAKRKGSTFKGRGLSLVKAKSARTKRPLISSAKKGETGSETARRIGSDIAAFFKGKRKEQAAKSAKGETLAREPIQVANFARRAHSRGTPLKKAIAQGRILHNAEKLNIAGKRIRATVGSVEEQN